MVPARPFFIGSPGWVRVQRLDLAFLIDRKHNGVGQADRYRARRSL
jgi:hypothetical protein